MIRHCNYCKIEHPLTPEYWYRLEGSPRCKTRVINNTLKRYSIKSEDIKAYNLERNRSLRALSRKRKPADVVVTRIRRNLRSRLNRALRGLYKSGSAIRDLGCSIVEFKQHLESKFSPGMSWDNYGMYGWHIDHIIPLVKFNLRDPFELQKAIHYNNLQPLWAVDNLKKGIK